jgi:hypothetical protein
VHGALTVPAARAFGEPGFHQVLTATGRLPVRLPRADRLVLSLRDLSRPLQRCEFHHPLSGCATVDWSDDPSRPNVPPGGVFTNTITVRIASGPRTLYLRSSGALSDRPEPFAPG